MKDWYIIDNIEKIDSPTVVLYEKHLEHNLQQMLNIVGGDINRLRPHLKTNKMPEVVKRMVKLGLKNFKSSTIAEAEMAAKEGAESVLIAHQLVGPKTDRFFTLADRFPETRFYTIIDNSYTLEIWETKAKEARKNVSVFIDINNGMNRSGVELGPRLTELIDKIEKTDHVSLEGLHVYDGHHCHPDYRERKEKLEAGFDGLTEVIANLKKIHPDLQVISGGTPAFTTHSLDKEKICSPGTCVFWDWGYDEKLTEQDFKFAVLLVSRVISKPAEEIVTIDLGHKAVAAENPTDRRVKFLNLSGYQLLSQSEEHGVLRVDNWENIRVGDVLYGIPYHICPTINLYDEIAVIRNGEKSEVWEITARKRRITI
ncbi:D-TA family PLP-dependent enzyme [Sinomicrobium sp. M5D2P17]